MKNFFSRTLLSFLAVIVFSCEENSLQEAAHKIAEVDAIYISDINADSVSVSASDKIRVYRDSILSLALKDPATELPFISGGIIKAEASLIAHELTNLNSLQRYCITEATESGSYENKFVIAYPEMEVFAYVVTGSLGKEVSTSDQHQSETTIKELVIFQSQNRKMTSFVSTYLLPDYAGDRLKQAALVDFFGLPIRHVQAVGLSRDSVSHEVSWDENFSTSPHYRRLRQELYFSLVTLRSIIENLAATEGDFYITSNNAGSETYSITDLMRRDKKLSMRDADCTTIELSVSTPVGGMCFKKTHVSNRSLILDLSNDIRSAYSETVLNEAQLVYSQLETKEGEDIWESIQLH